MNIYRLAFCSIVSAIAVLFMFISNFFPFGSFFVMFCGFFVYIIGLELGKKLAFCVYFVVGVLSFFFVYSKRNIFMFIFFVGLYPIVKLILEEFKNKFVIFIAKCLLFFLVSAIFNLLIYWFSKLFFTVNLKMSFDIMYFKYNFLFHTLFLCCFIYDVCIYRFKKKCIKFFREKFFKNLKYK